VELREVDPSLRKRVHMYWRAPGQQEYRHGGNQLQSSHDGYLIGGQRPRLPYTNQPTSPTTPHAMWDEVPDVSGQSRGGHGLLLWLSVDDINSNADAAQRARHQ
jgi:hypothetical protein